MSLEIKRLHLAKLSPPGGERGQWPVHGFVITHPGGAVLVDTGVGGPEDLINDWRVVNVSAADALAELDMSPADISLVINTHLHFDHCGQNAVFKHAPFYVQRAELERARRESSALAGWFDFMGARFELLDGDSEILPRPVGHRDPRPHRRPPVRHGQHRRRLARPADRGRRLYAARVHRPAGPEAATRPGRRPAVLGGLHRARPVDGPVQGPLLSSHRRGARLNHGRSRHFRSGE
jgi:hypothetical protein